MRLTCNGRDVAEIATRASAYKGLLRRVVEQKSSDESPWSLVPIAWDSKNLGTQYTKEKVQQSLLIATRWFILCFDVAVLWKCVVVQRFMGWLCTRVIGPSLNLVAELGSHDFFARADNRGAPVPSPRYDCRRDGANRSG